MKTIVRKTLMIKINKLRLRANSYKQKKFNGLSFGNYKFISAGHFMKEISHCIIKSKNPLKEYIYIFIYQLYVMYICMYSFLSYLAGQYLITVLIKEKTFSCQFVFTNGPGDLGSIPGRIIPKTSNGTWYLLA